MFTSIPARGHKADICHGHVASHLSHPLFVRMRRDAGDVDSTSSQVYEEQSRVATLDGGSTRATVTGPSINNGLYLAV